MINVIMLSVFVLIAYRILVLILSVIGECRNRKYSYAEFHEVKCHYSDCLECELHYTECHYSESCDVERCYYDFHYAWSRYGLLLSIILLNVILQIVILKYGIL
jgi:hypothetical protein